MFRPVFGLASVVIMLCVILTGCGSAQNKLENAAVNYVKAKYGFKPEVKDFQFRKVGQYEWNWNKKDGGTVTMDYEGHEFKVQVLHTENSEYACLDNYLEEETLSRIEEYFGSVLKAESIYYTVTYGTPARLLGADITTYDELITECDNMEIQIRTYKLDTDSVGNVDASLFGEKTHIYIGDWKSESDAKEPETAGWFLPEQVKRYSVDRMDAYYHFHDGDVEN